MANGVEQITSDTITKEGKPQAMPRLQDHKIDRPPKLGDASFGAGQYIQLNVFSTSESSLTSRRHSTEFAMMISEKY